MQALLLLAGKNSRFFPLEKTDHKGMFKIFGKPLVRYVIDDLAAAGVKEFIAITGQHGEKIEAALGDGSDMGISIKYVSQESPLGQGDAILAARDLITDAIIVTNPYHFGQKQLFIDSIKRFEKEKLDGLIPGKYEENIHNYGALLLDGDKILGVIEKPEKGHEPSNYKATAAYIFSKEFISFLEKEKPQEYSYEAAISTFASQKNVRMHEIAKDHFLPTLKYPWQLLDALTHIAAEKKGFIHETAFIAKNAIVEDTVYVDEGAKVFEGACVKGHTYIGKNAVVGNNSVVRDSDLGEGVQVGVNSDITRSIIMRDTHSHGGGFIGDSIIGDSCRLAAGFTTANKRTDRANIVAEVKGEKVDTGTNALGVIMGQSVKTGINVSTMPGKFIGENSQIWPGGVVYNNLQHNSLLKVIQQQDVRILS